MRRRREIKRHQIAPDTRFGSVELSRFINLLMYSGKKGVAERIVYAALEDAAARASKPSIEVFTQAVENIKPTVEVRSRRVGGATYQVPVEVRPERAHTLAMRWLLDAARKRSEKTMERRLASELFEACEERGTAFKKREDIHRMAEANRAFAHYRW